MSTIQELMSASTRPTEPFVLTAWWSLFPHWYMNVGSKPKGPERQRMSIPTVWRFSWLVESPAGAPPPSAATELVPPEPTNRRLMTECLAVPDVRPSAGKYAYSGLMARPLDGVISGRQVLAQSSPRLVRAVASARLPPASWSSTMT